MWGRWGKSFSRFRSVLGPKIARHFQGWSLFQTFPKVRASVCVCDWPTAENLWTSRSSNSCALPRIGGRHPEPCLSIIPTERQVQQCTISPMAILAAEVGFNPHTLQQFWSEVNSSTTAPQMFGSLNTPAFPNSGVSKPHSCHSASLHPLCQTANQCNVLWPWALAISVCS